MNKLPRAFAIILLILAIGGITYGVYRYNPQSIEPSPSIDDEPQVESNQIFKGNSDLLTPAPKESGNGLVYPIAQFKERITKKPFGIYITPQDSPVQPERFRGFHTAVDIEYEDVIEDVPVFAINDCKIVISRIAQGYGGVFVASTEIAGAKHSIIYGHIRPSTLPKANAQYKKGAQIGFLGTGYSAETDGERRHLHFGILADSGTDLRGYVQQKDELEGWIDPIKVLE